MSNSPKWWRDLDDHTLRAQPTGVPYWRWYPVERRLIDASVDRLRQTRLTTDWVAAPDVAAAANEALAALDGPAEVFAVGPRGGIAYRYRGWWGTIAAAVLGTPCA